MNEWPIIRGFYMGPKVSDADFKVWTDTFDKMMATPSSPSCACRAQPSTPFAMTGADLDAYISSAWRLSPDGGQDFGLNVAKVNPPGARARVPALGPVRPDREEQHTMSDRILGGACVVVAAGMAWAPRTTCAEFSTNPSARAPFRCCWPPLMALGGLWLICSSAWRQLTAGCTRCRSALSLRRAAGAGLRAAVRDAGIHAGHGAVMAVGAWPSAAWLKVAGRRRGAGRAAVPGLRQAARRGAARACFRSSWEDAEPWKHSTT